MSVATDGECCVEGKGGCVKLERIYKGSCMSQPVLLREIPLIAPSSLDLTRGLIHLRHLKFIRIGTLLAVHQIG